MTRRRFRVAAWAGLAALALGAVSTSARDLGVRGATWPVAEPDLLAGIEARLAHMVRSGEMARVQDEARERARRSLEEPEPVPGIVPATRQHTRRFDPAIVVAEDIVGPNGEVIAAAGTKIDPFDHAPLTGDVLFVDGRREAEVAWALAHERPAKIVLLAGRPLDLMRRHGRPFYFDIGGRLSERFSIRATPTLLAHPPGGGQSPGGEPSAGAGQSYGGAHAGEGTYLLLTEFLVVEPSPTVRSPGDTSARDPSATGCVPETESTIKTTDRRESPC